MHTRIGQVIVSDLENKELQRFGNYNRKVCLLGEQIEGRRNAAIHWEATIWSLGSG